MVVETNRYYHLFLDNADDGPFPTWGKRSGNAYVLGSDITDGTYNSWQTGGLLEENRSFAVVYGQTMVRARYYDILRFLHFTDNNRNGVDMTDDRLENKILI